MRSLAPITFAFAFAAGLALTACGGATEGDGQGKRDYPRVDGDEGEGEGDSHELVIPEGCESHAATLTQFADDFDQALADNGVPGGVFGLLVGDCLFTHGVGVDREGNPIDGHTRFQMASVSKFFASITAESLATDGTIDLSAPVSSIVGINDTAPYDTAFTLHDVLAHRSGYPDWFVGDENEVLSRADYFNAHASESLWAPPGAVFVYNNQGYELAAYALETAAGAPYSSLVQERVFDAADLSETRLGTTMDTSEAGFAQGHTGDAITIVDVDDPLFTSEFYEAMGGVWSSASDLVKLGGAFMNANPALITEAARDDMATSRGPMSGQGGAYGHGLMMYGDLWTHDGATSGFLTELSMMPKAGIAFAAMVSCDWFYPYDFSYEVFGTLAPDADYGAYPEDTRAAEWTGSYTDDVIVGGTVEVTADGDNLVLTFPDATTSTFEFAYDATWYGPLFDWGDDMELVMQQGEDGTRYLTTRGFVATSALQ